MNGMTFVNTPGYYYSIAYFLAAFLVNRTNKQRDGVKGWKRWLIHIGFFGGIVGFMDRRCTTEAFCSVHAGLNFYAVVLYLSVL